MALPSEAVSSFSRVNANKALPRRDLMHMQRIYAVHPNRYEGDDNVECMATVHTRLAEDQPQSIIEKRIGAYICQQGACTRMSSLGSAVAWAATLIEMRHSMLR